MALSVDSTSLILKSGTIKRGTWVTPNLIGTNNTRPRTYFTGVVMGSIKRGTQVVNLPKEYVEAIVKTPGQLFRKDVVMQPFTIEGQIYEMTGDVMSIFFNRTAQLAYSITVPVTETIDLIHIGSDGPQLVAAGYLIEALDVTDREIEIAMYYGLNTPEDQAINMSGDDYSVASFKLEATPYVGATDDKKNYGYFLRKTA